MKKLKEKVIVLSKDNSYSREYVSSLSEIFEIYFFSDKKYFEIELEKIKPDWIFALHWNFIISEKIFKKYKCVTFHTGNLPKDRGGSPIQNQIINNKTLTKVNAIKVSKKIDAGAIYLSEQISLQGSIADIFDVIIPICTEFTKKIILENITPTPQTGDAETFKRKRDNLIRFNNLKSIYDQIRMLDGLDYPKSFYEVNGFKLEFSRAQLNNNFLIADVKIKKNE